MNTTILQKCLKELESENVRIDYIRGMLETMLELSSKIIYTPPTTPLSQSGVFSTPGGTFSTANAGIPSRSNLDEIKRMAGEA